MNVYGDTSALVKLVLSEVGSDETRQLVEACELLVAASIGYTELRAAIAAAARDGRLDEGGLIAAKELVETIWEGVTPVDITLDLVRAAGQGAEVDGLRAYDAVHQAALLTLGEPNPELVFACFDIDLRGAVASRGYTLFPIALA